MLQVNAKRFKKNKKFDDHVKDVDFFREFNKVKNTVFAINNWVKALERFCETKGYSEKIENVENVEELDKQLSDNIFTSFSKTVNRKIKYLTDLSHGEANGSDGLTAKEIKYWSKSRQT
ncbi:hypothetical protein C1646_772408 [Rhizophagus diaphanus]|nr:hypothetical protein C1646_772408 [Rhizophagus diaphanus] [Rhizophagus sp. MUCL 43196]